MNSTTKIIIAAALSVGVVGGASAFGKKKFADPEMKAKFAVNFIAEELELDAIQKQALTALKNQVLESGQLVRSQMENTHEDVKTLVVADSFDQAKALSMVTEKTSAVNSVAPEIITAAAGFFDSLSIEQKTEILEFFEDHHGRRGRHGKWGH